MRHKYVLEKFGGIWFEFGGETENSNAIICSPHNEKAADLYNELIYYTAEMACAFAEAAPDEFDKFYYGICVTNSPQS